ncbi:MAG: ATP-binding cassette domain-containing protein [Pseudomonadota bacterium]
MAQPPFLTLQNIALTFGSTPLLEAADLMVMPRARVALVGRNGSGKSTLLKIAAGLVEPDAGDRFLQPGTTVRYMPQEPDMAGHATLRDYVLAGLGPADDPYRADYLMERLAVKMDADPAKVSGGEARRAALARTLAPEPDIVLLDEPTNHLDLPVIEWLEGELTSLRSALVFISHDRRFAENLSRQTVWIDRGRSRTMDKGFAHFEGWRDTLLEEEELERHKLDRKIVREEHWVVHGVSGRRKRNVRRLADLATLRETRATARKVQGGVQMTVGDAETSGKIAIKAKGISKSYGERDIVKPLDLTVQRGDRIGLVGPNGSGKTTLVRLLTAEIEPDTGTVKHGTKLDMVTLDQKREALNPDWTLKDALTDGSGDMVEVAGQQKHVMTYMKEFLFAPEQARTPLHALSGGERGRLMLARALRIPSNLMVLDEPTNDLDLETLDLLQEMLADYAGTVILVSHDRDFLDRVCTSVLMAEGDGKWIEYAGGYTDMVSQRGAGVAALGADEGKRAEKSGAKAKTAAPKAGNAKLSFKQKYALENLPKEIEALHARIEQLSVKMSDPDFFARDPDGFAKATDQVGEAQARKDAAEEEWLELEMLREEMEG